MPLSSSTIEEFKRYVDEAAKLEKANSEKTEKESEFTNMAEPESKPAEPPVAPAPVQTPAPAAPVVQTQPEPKVDYVALIKDTLNSSVGELKKEMSSRIDALEAQMKPPEPAPEMKPAPLPEPKQSSDMDAEVKKLRAQVEEMQKSLNAPTRQSAVITSSQPSPEKSLTEKLRDLDREELNKIRASMPK